MLCMIQIRGRLTGQAHCLVLFGLEDVQQGLAEAGCVFSLVGMSVVCFVGWFVDGGTFRKSSSAWRRASALVDRVAWMRVLRAAASMVGESDRIEYWIPRQCVLIVVLCVNSTSAPPKINCKSSAWSACEVFALKLALAWVQGLAVAFFDRDSGAKQTSTLVRRCQQQHPATQQIRNRFESCDKVPAGLTLQSLLSGKNARYSLLFEPDVRELERQLQHEEGTLQK
jgi:hypothetical protein